MSALDIGGPLPANFARSLPELESVIQRGLSTFVEVGTALAEVRDRHLYRETHGTFEDYCADKWHLSRSRAHRLIEAADVAAALLPIGNVPANEGQARELAPIVRDHGPEKAAEVLSAAAADGPVTAASIRAKAEDMGARPTKPVCERPTPPRVTVDTETGEVLPATPAPVAEVANAAAKRDEANAKLDEVLSSDPSVQDARYRYNLSKELARAITIAQFDPSRVADLLDQEAWSVVEMTVDALADWRQKVARARNPLRVVGGSK